jgi:FdhD protein
MPTAETGAKQLRFSVLKPTAETNETIERATIIEAPISIEYNGIGYAVMMATPIDLSDYAIGFSLSEQLIDELSQIVAVDCHQSDKGWLVRIQLPPDKIEKIIDRARQRVSESSCGLCGMDNLDAVMRPLPPVTAQLDLSKDAVFTAMASLRAHQTLNAATGASHAAAFCDPSGAILLAREDVGRHNALDKLIGALAQAGLSASDGFMLLTARCSFELVQKAIIANCPYLVTISAATDLAITTAQQHGLSLISLARPDSALAATPQTG